MTENALNDNPIIITGGAQRLGLAAALALNEQGYKVVISYRTARAEIAELESKNIDCIQADFSDDSGVYQFIDTIKQRYQHIRAIVHNASTWSPDPKDNNLEQSAKVFDDMMQIHAKAPLLINKALQGYMQKGGDIIHISDQVADLGSMKHLAYAASKAALENLTTSFARQLAPDVQVNAIAPALIIFNEWDDAQYREKALKKSLLGIEPGVGCFVDSVLFLLQNNYITGRVLPLDGGRHLQLP